MTGSATSGSGRHEQTTVYLVGVAVVLGFFLLLFWREIFVVILPGHVGVVYDLFRGTRLGVHSREGLTVKLPWNRMYIYDVRLQNAPLQVHALSREGMVVDIDVIVLFRPRTSEISRLHQEIGPEYVRRAVIPLSISAVREYVAQHDSHELYTVEAAVLKRDIIEATRAELAMHHIAVDNVLLERLILPKNVLSAIEEKLTQEQIAAAYGFRLEAEKAEAQRLEIKGAALSRYYALVNGALTPSLLTWRGIEATVELAQSSNSKIVVIGSGKDQLPIILGSDITKLPEPPAARPAQAPRPGTPPERSVAPRISPPDSTTPERGTSPPITPPAGVPVR
jgi:regulator of protease activity HflC (stomatin/prohibitin superfamily)